tara:strand:- start:3133 stop:3282 length:150 start_codon:yes stop_codon:yes gene_type:complete
MTTDERELWEERAAIREFDGQMSREMAEKLAAADLGFLLDDIRDDTQSS